MNKDLKIALIVFGSLFGLLAIALIGAITFAALSISHHVKDSNANSGVTAAKIAKMTLPAKYRYGMAMDLAFMNMVTIEPKAGPRTFLIEIEGISVPSAATDDDQLDKAMQQGIGGQCLARTDRGEEKLTTASGKSVTLKLAGCASASGTQRIAEYGRIPSPYPIAFLIAIGPATSFDHDALRSIVRSIR